MLKRMRAILAIIIALCLILCSIRLQLFSKCSFNPMSVIGYDVG